jgi:hypothetical protein
MPYTLITFDSVTLPDGMGETPLTTGEVASGLTQAAGGMFDRYGTRQVLPASLSIALRALYDNRSTALQTQLDALRAKTGVYGQLVRKRASDATLQNINARLLAVNGTLTPGDINAIMLDMQWESTEATWRSATVTTATGSVGGNTSLVNDGTAPVYDAVITVTATSSLVNPTFIISALGVSLKYTGTVNNTKALVIDCGAKTVKNDGANAYSGFSLQAAHTARNWMPLTVATHTLAVAASSGTGNVSVAFYKRWF